MSHCRIRVHVNNFEESRAFYQAVLAPANLFPTCNRSDGTAIGFTKAFFGFNLPPSLWLVASGAPLTSDLDSDLSPGPSKLPDTGEEENDGFLKDVDVEVLESGSGRVTREPSNTLVTCGVYIAIEVGTRRGVDGFYKAALAAGGKNGSEPTNHPRRGRWYYSASVEDPEGRTIELACNAFPFFAGKHGESIKAISLILYVVAVLFWLK